ncbi:MAG TPA: HAD family hydrolase [Polyangiaceae bacterium]|nr:HAD family hydrolase [Polyangiaceae bacterium]
MVLDDPLPSWKEGPVKKALLDFVARIGSAQSVDYVPIDERIATFDNDGTLWCEYPLQPQIYYTLQRLDHLARLHPALQEQQPYRAFLERDLKTIATFSKREALTPAFAVYAGMTVEDLQADVRIWFETAVHPFRKQLFAHCTYLPQLELIQFLRANGFKNYIVTGGGVEFVRAVGERLYGIPPERVIGSSTQMELELTEGRARLRKLPALHTFNDRDEKAVNIGRHIGRRPILAFGNSDGDLAMLRYVLAGSRARLGLLLHHDDVVREFAYDRTFRLSPLVEGLESYRAYGAELVSMKRDWNRVFR